ncbi:MAG: glycosyltransferase, partial [Deltaproteobacteria bacterium]|nr:glycosyltransferase [Deltaproteobacteria bacterium]
DSIVAPAGVDVDGIEAITKGVQRNERFSLFFGARMNAVKQPDRIIEVYDYFYRYGRDIDIVVTTGTQELPAIKMRRKVKKGRDYLSIRWACGREEYLKEAARCHAFICWSTSEGFPVGFWEQMYLGLVGLFPNKKWAVRQLPEGYKWVFNTKQEAYAMLMEIASDWEKHHRDMAHVRKLIREEYRIGKIYAVMEADLEGRIADRKTYRMTKGVVALLEEVLPVAGDRFSLAQLVDLMNQQGRAFMAENKARSATFRYPSNYDIHRWLLDNGYRDLCDGRMPRYERVGN